MNSACCTDMFRTPTRRLCKRPKSRIGDARKTPIRRFASSVSASGTACKTPERETRRSTILSTRLKSPRILCALGSLPSLFLRSQHFDGPPPTWHADCVCLQNPCAGPASNTMNYGMYISTSGALNASYRQDLHASNLANVNTVGFKPELATTRQRDPVRTEDNLGFLPSSDLLERLGAGVMADRTRTDYSQGIIRATGNDLDLAIKGEGFFTLLDEQDKTENRYRLTRDGRFTRNTEGTMVSVTNGMPLVGTNGNPIKIPGNAPVTIQPDGSILQNGVEIAKIGFVEITNRAALQKAPNGLFVADATQMANKMQATGHLEQGAIEEAAVNEIATLMKIEGAARDAQANIGMIGYHDRLLNQAINRFARVG